MELTQIPDEEWNQVVKDAEEFWGELASISPCKANSTAADWREGNRKDRMGVA